MIAKTGLHNLLRCFGHLAPPAHDLRTLPEWTTIKVLYPGRHGAGLLHEMNRPVWTRTRGGVGAGD